MNADLWKNRHSSVAHFEVLFDYKHLPPHLRVISAPFAEQAELMIALLHDGIELSAGLRKLVEAKDCMVRQAVADHRASNEQAG